MTLSLLPVAMASTAILGCNKPFQFYRFIKSTIDEMGRDVPEFAAPVTLTGSIQTVSSKIREQLGLNLDDNYETVFCPALMQSIAEKLQPDRIVYDNRTYEIVENKNWYKTNGWAKVLIVEIKSLRKNGGTDTIQNPESDI